VETAERQDLHLGMVAADGPGGGNTIHIPGQAHIHQHHVWLRLITQVQSFLTVVRFSYQLDVVHRHQREADTSPQKLVIVHG
jgi:hypothetical protein